MSTKYRLIGPALPLPVDKQGGDIAGQILGGQGDGLPFSGGQVGCHANGSMAADTLVQDHLAGSAFARVDLRPHGETVIARRINVARLIRKTCALKANDGAVDNHLSFVVRV